MTSSSIASSRTKKQISPAIGRPWHPLPRERNTISVYVKGEDWFEIDTNQFDMVDADKIIIDFYLDDSWNERTDLLCAVNTDKTVEVLNVIDRRLIIPRRHMSPGSLKLQLFGFYEPKRAGCRFVNGYFVLFEDADPGLIDVGGDRFVATQDHDKTMREASVYIDVNDHYIATSYVGVTRPKEYDQPISDDNPYGYMTIDMHDIPIEIGSWYDR